MQILDSFNSKHMGRRHFSRAFRKFLQKLMKAAVLKKTAKFWGPKKKKKRAHTSAADTQGSSHPRQLPCVWQLLLYSGLICAAVLWCGGLLMCLVFWGALSSEVPCLLMCLVFWVSLGWVSLGFKLNYDKVPETIVIRIFAEMESWDTQLSGSVL